MQTVVRQLVEGLAARWQQYRSAQSMRTELERADPAMLRMLASEMGLSPAELIDSAASGYQADELMLSMAQAFGVDPAQLSREAPWVFRDLGVVCARCGDKKRCAREISAGTARANADDFCPNAAHFPELAASLSPVA